MSEKRILVGTQSFRELRENKKTYIDKTTFISEFLSGETAKVSLITRPRRFGKSLMLDMLREFFDQTNDSSEIFDGLAVSQDKELCAKWMNKYPVIYLSLNEMKGKSFEKCYNRFKEIAGRLCEDNDYLFKSNKVKESVKNKLYAIQNCSASIEQVSDVILTVCRAIYQDCGIKPIILIDEYDAPFAKLNCEKDYDNAIDFLSALFETGLKSNIFFKFAILTGCLRIAKENVFTGINNFKCYGINDYKFSDKFGFTHDEVQALLAATGFSDKMGAMQEWYDGYCFGGNKSMYCPWDVMQYVSDLKEFSETEPQAYWFNSSSNDLVKAFIDKIDVLPVGKKIASLMQGGTVKEKCNENMTYNNLYNSESNLWTVLYLTGYLTKIPQAKKEIPFKPIELRIPNREVYYIFKEEISAWFSKLTGGSSYTVSLVNEALWNGDEQTVSQLVSDLVMCNTSCHDGTHIGKEGFYHAFLLGLLSNLDYDLFSNIESGTGRPDILIDDREHNRAIVIEIKYTDDKTGLEKEAKGALTQSQDRQYAAPLLARKRTVLTWGLAFCPKQCLAKCGQAG